AALPNLVDDEDLPLANVLIGSAWGTMLAVGAALGGIVAAALGRDAAFVLDAASFAVSASLIVGIRRSFGGAAGATDGAPRAGFRASFVETWTLARGSRRISALLLAKTTFGVGAGAIFLLAVFGSTVFKAGDVGIGVLFAARGFGALLGPFLARAVVRLDERGTFVGIGLSYGVFVGAYLLLPLAPGIAIAAVLVFVGHLGGGAQWMLSSLGLQRAVPDVIRGRVFSADYALVELVVAVSTLIAGAVAAAAGPGTALYTLMIPAAFAALAWLIWTRPLRRADSATLPG
ncbi:MAG: MFS transporter, partial [Candidatus Limnocylindrales bacterium]